MVVPMPTSRRPVALPDYKVLVSELTDPDKTSDDQLDALIANGAHHEAIWTPVEVNSKVVARS